MDYAKRLEELEKEKREILKIQAHCDHKWVTKYDPVEEEICTYEQRKQGSDVYTVAIPTGRYKLVPRWSRKCEKCGKVEYTKDEYHETISVSRGPRF